MTLVTTKTHFCNFCGKSEHEVVSMIGHNESHICKACVELAIFILNLNQQPEYCI
jgi:hypothetical protein